MFFLQCSIQPITLHFRTEVRRSGGASSLGLYTVERPEAYADALVETVPISDV